MLSLLFNVSFGHSISIYWFLHCRWNKARCRNKLSTLMEMLLWIMIACGWVIRLVSVPTMKSGFDHILNHLSRSCWPLHNIGLGWWFQSVAPIEIAWKSCYEPEQDSWVIQQKRNMFCLHNVTSHCEREFDRARLASLLISRRTKKYNYDTLFIVVVYNCSWVCVCDRD